MPLGMEKMSEHWRLEVKTKQGPLQGPMKTLCHELLSVINSILFICRWGGKKKKGKAPHGSSILVTSSTEEDKAAPSSIREVGS